MTLPKISLQFTRNFEFTQYNNLVLRFHTLPGHNLGLGWDFFRKAQKFTKIGKLLTIFRKGTLISVTIAFMKGLQYTYSE